MSAIVQISPEVWDQQYRDGAWERLKGYTAHYAVIAGMLRKYAAESVLDVGCGEGLLRRFLHDELYFGIDISAEAIRKARPGHFAVVDVWDFTRPWPPPDFVVFCESLYYMEDPFRLLGNYLDFSMRAIVSVFISDKTDELVDGLRERFKVLDEVEIRQGDSGWRVMVLPR